MNNGTTHWFLVGRVLDFPEPMNVQLFLTRAGLATSEFAVAALFQLHKAITDSPILN